MSGPLRVLLADNSPTRTGMRVALTGAVTICGEVELAAEAIRVAGELQPDACLLGRQLLDAGCAPLRELCRAAPACAVVVFAPEGDAGDMVEAVRAGALGYVPGALTAERLRSVVRAVGGREAIVPRALTRELLLALREDDGRPAGVTAREAEVLLLLRRGGGTREIADHLRIAPVTVRRHISELVRKLEVADRAALVPSDGAQPSSPARTA